MRAAEAVARRHADHHRRARHRDAARHRDGQDADRGPADVRSASQEGQLVKQGDFLAQIDPRPYEATLAQAQAQLAKDTSLHDQASADLARYETLSKQDSIAHQQVDDQAFLVAQDKAAMASDQAQIDAAKLNIYYTHIVSPINGRVGLRLVDPGNYVQPTDATGLVVITQLDPISVVFSTPEDNLPRITRRLNAGAKLPVTVFDRANVKQARRSAS